MPVGERTPFVSREKITKTFPEPLIFQWRAIHNFFYLVGGSTFAVGSFQYFPTVSNLSLGGWLFTIGSVGFLIADTMEWWTNNRVGCFRYKEFEESYESLVSSRFADVNTVWGKLQRAEIGANFFTSWIGSLLYLIGSVLEIPTVNQSPTGNILFIYGSFVIMVAQTWKLFRNGRINELDWSDTTFRLSNFKEDVYGALVDLTAGVGASGYFIGSFYLLAQNDLNTRVTHSGVQWYCMGGSFFFLSGIFMFIRYFLLNKFPSDETGKGMDSVGMV